MVSRKGIVALTLFGVTVLVLTAGSLHHTTSPYLRFGSQYPAFIAPDILDSENRLLTSSQCQDRYPGLYYEADRAKAYYARKGGITHEMVESADKDGASARLAIVNNKVRFPVWTILNSQLYVKAFYGGINTRSQAAVAAVYSTLLTDPEPMPDVE